MKHKGLFIAAIALIVIGGILLGTAFFCGGTGMFIKDGVNTKYVIIADTVRNIKIDVTSEDVKIVPTNESQCRILYPDDESVKYEADLEGDTVTITAEEKDDILNFFAGAVYDHITIELPIYDGYNIEANTSSGKIDVSVTSENGSIKLSSSSGDIEFFGAAKDISVKTGSGDIEFHGAKAASGNIKIESSSGEVDVENVECDTLSVITKSGDADVSGIKSMHAGQLSSFAVYIETQSGEVSFEDVFAPATSIITGSGDVEGEIRDEYIFQVNSRSGRIRVPQSSLNAKYLLKIETGSGDIEIERD
ncbi:MAG: DUF4097 family beta strand repeat protein [Clostridiales bacterium]|nr:DUF4097 family beta strand repeat protein [Candidatus Coliplasma equi]